MRLWPRRAHDRLMRQVACIAHSEAAELRRRDFLGHIPLHREILDAWVARLEGRDRTRTP